MSCIPENAIIVVKGNDTNFNNQAFLTLRLNTEVLDLSTFTATFSLCGITKTFTDISSGEIEINYSAVETAQIPYGKQNGVLKLIDSSHRVATIESLIPFEFISIVHGDAIATRPYEMTINVEQGGENILDITVEAGVSVEVGTTTTLPAGSNATVTNSGSENHLVLDFGIPAGDGIKSIEKTGSSGLVDTYTITFDTGNTETFEITNGNGITNIIKTSTVGLVDTYTIYLDNGQTKTFTVTNGKDATINGVNALTLNTAYGLSLNQSGDTATISGKAITDVVDGISALIPAQASLNNQLADKAFVNSTTQTATANFRGNWEDWASVPTNAEDYPLDYAQSRTPTVNDYLVVRDASGYTEETLEGTWRFKYSGDWSINGKNGWHPEYQVNETPLTAAQLAALNSGATEAKIDQITTNQNAIGTLSNLTTTEKTNLVGAVNELDSSKQDNISDLQQIRDGAAAGASSVQPSQLGTAAYENANSFATAAQGVKADGAVRFNSAQSLTETQKTQARNNIDAGAKTIIREWVG